jgi:hypothetical protein
MPNYTLLATYMTHTGDRYYTRTTYRWFDDGDVEVRTVTGDDDWDSYNGYDSESTEIVRFESLSKDIQDHLKANQT